LNFLWNCCDSHPNAKGHALVPKLLLAAQPVDNRVSAGK
jgi:hypothetical protein